MIDWNGALFLALYGLLAVGVGMVLGAVIMRGNYLRVIRWLNRIITRQQREMNRMVRPME